MATWGSRGLRGSTLEELINRTIEKYRESGLALIQKIPTPITPMQIDKNKHITLAYFDKKSTVDYMGVVQSVPVCFDAKEVHADTFNLQNVHAHQMSFMEDFEKQQGISFFILYYAHKNEFYYMPFTQMKFFWDRAKEGGRKSFTYDELDKTGLITEAAGLCVHFLPHLQKDILEH